METKIRSLIKEAMLEKNKEKQITYKNILECAQKIAKQTNVSVTDEMIVKAIKNEMKQLNDVLVYYTSGTEKYEEVKTKLQYCEVLLPKMATEEEIIDYLMKNTIEKNIGICMKKLKEYFGMNMDGKLASKVAKEYTMM